MRASLPVDIDVADGDAARDFYVGAFGWRVGRRLGNRLCLLQFVGKGYDALLV